MPNVKDFLEWVDQFEGGSLANKVQIVSDEPEEGSGARRVRLNLFTQNHRYAICAINKRARPRSYLGCICYNRAPHAGEEHIRCRDLSDGDLSKSTWQAIKDDIIRTELVNMGAPQFNPRRD